VAFYKESANYVKVISVLLCTIGVVLFYNGESAGSIIGIVIAFSSGITYSFYIIYIDKSGLKSMHPMKLTFYLCLIASPVIFIWSILTGTFTTNITPLGWFLTSVLSIAVSVGAVGLFQVGISIIGSQSTAILSTFEPITSVIIGILVFDEVFDLKVLVGCVLILVSAILLAVFDKDSKVDECKKVYET
jgi:drug/metabolite transporter (DMT)-like permease